MNFSFQQRTGFPKTPKLLKRLLLSIGLFSIGSIIADSFLSHFTHMFLFKSLFTLSPAGIMKGFFWQPITYLFLLPIDQGITFAFIINLFFTLYFLWVVGTKIYNSLGKSSFITLFIISGILSAICAVVLACFFSIPGYISGCGAVMLAFLVIWCMLTPEQEIMLFMMLPIKIKWLAVIAVGICLMQQILAFDWFSLTLYLSAIVLTYIYATCAHALSTPFKATQFIDKNLAQFGAVLKKKFYKVNNISTKNKIFDFKTGEAVLNDEDFINAMLDKISQYGDKSLSFREKRRLRKISKTKRYDSH